MTENSIQDTFQKVKKIIFVNRQKDNPLVPMLEALGLLSEVIKNPEVTKAEKNMANGLSAVVCCYIGAPNKAIEFNDKTKETFFTDNNLYSQVALAYTNFKMYLEKVAYESQYAYQGDSHRKEYAEYLINTCNSIASILREEYEIADGFTAFDMYFDILLVFDLALKLQTSGWAVDLYFYKSMLDIPWQKSGASCTEIPNFDDGIFDRLNAEVKGLITLLPKDQR